MLYPRYELEKFAYSVIINIKVKFLENKGIEGFSHYSQVFSASIIPFCLVFNSVIEQKNLKRKIKRKNTPILNPHSV